MEQQDYGKALAEMWALGGKAFLEAQQQALRAMREGAAAMGLPAGAATPGAAPGAALPAMAPPAAATPAFPNLAFDAGEIGKAGQALADLWASSNDLAAALARRLPQSGADADSTAAATLRRMVDPRVWLGAGDDMEEALQRMAQGPRFADLWDTERRYAKVFQAWMTLRRRGLEHQAVVLEGWTTAARRFADRLAELSSKGQPPPTQQDALNLWIGTANRALLEMQRSERYLDSQARLLKASTELRLAQQEVAEYHGQMFGLPTRTELDDVHRTVTELRRELRATQRRLRAAASAATPAPERQTLERPAVAVAEMRARPARRGEKAEG
jgi:polyhydroxyalkanoate synthase subunit PhaE